MGTTSARKDDQIMDQQIEFVESDLKDIKKNDNVMGTVKLTDDSIVYIPTPTTDPQDPLNMALWQKLVILVVISTFSCLGVSLVSGFGGLITFYIPEYAAAGQDYADISELMTYPTLFMGIGNLIGMPLAIAVGRRIVILGSTLILIIGAVLCAVARTYEWHLAARMILGLCAGQSEALVPMITQELFFLHERGKSLMMQQSIQVLLTTVYVLFASPIAGAITPQGWYWLGAGLACLQFITAFIWLPETKYERNMQEFQEASSADLGLEAGDSAKLQAKVCKVKPPLDFINHSPRTWKSDLRLWIHEPDWLEAFNVLKQTIELLFFPNVFWALCINGLSIGVNIAIGTTYATILTSPPYNWPDSSTSYVNCGQIVVALVFFPILGMGSDALIKWFAARNNGIHEPETRLLPMFIPILVGTFTSVLYGQGGSFPAQYHWFVYAWAVAAYYFCFIGINIATMTYLLDSYPARHGPLLVIICAFRGFISFGTSYGTTRFIAHSGYDGAFGIFGALTAVLGILGLPVYFWGKKIRHFTGRFAKSKQD